MCHWHFRGHYAELLFQMFWPGQCFTLMAAVIAEKFSDKASHLYLHTCSKSFMQAETSKGQPGCTQAMFTKTKSFISLDTNELEVVTLEVATFDLF